MVVWLVFAGVVGREVVSAVVMAFDVLGLAYMYLGS